MNQLPSLALFLVPLLFFTVLFFTPQLIARTSGWKLLASRFRAQGEFFGSKWSWQSAQMRYRTNYNNCLTVGADQAGLFLQPMVLFRFGHPPLFVPWSEISGQTTQILWMTFLELRLGRTEQVPFRIRPALASRIQAAAGPGWPVVSTI